MEMEYNLFAGTCLKIKQRQSGNFKKIALKGSCWGGGGGQNAK
jgi:hypothetical protein